MGLPGRERSFRMFSAVWTIHEQTSRNMAFVHYTCCYQEMGNLHVGYIVRCKLQAKFYFSRSESLPGTFIAELKDAVRVDTGGVELS